MSEVANGAPGSATRRFRPMIPPKRNRESPSTSLVESPARGPMTGGGVIFRVKRRRDDEPLEALLVAERAPKRGAGVSLQAYMDSLSLGMQGPGVVHACGGGGGGGCEGLAMDHGMVNEESAGNTSSSSSMHETAASGAHMLDSARKVFKLFGSVPQDVDLALPQEGENADKVREHIRKMTGEQATSRPSIASSAQRTKEVARIVDLEVEPAEGGGLTCRSASDRIKSFDLSPSPARHLAEAVTSPFTTPAGKGGGGGGGAGDSRIDSLVEATGGGYFGGGGTGRSPIMCNGSPLIRETLLSPVRPPRQSPAEVKIDEAFEGEREGERERRREGDEYVYDYYWIDPDAERGGFAEGKVANVEVDLDDLWDDDGLILEEENWESDHAEDSDDSNAENCPHNEYPDEDDDGGHCDEEDFDHSLVGGLYDKAIPAHELSDDADSGEDERFNRKNLRRFAFNGSDDSGEDMSNHDDMSD